MIETKWVEFGCQQCGELIEAKEKRVGTMMRCPCCLKDTKMELPNALEVRKAVPRASCKDVQVKVGVGKLGSLETTISKKDAGTVVHTLMGGLMVALGVIVCMMLGVKAPMSGVKPPLFGVRPKMW